jgi:AcrR family transcriptional regulator
MSGLRERKKDRTREQLARAAIALFIERGYEATTVEDIAAQVEVSPRTFFRYFPAKEDVVIDLLQAGVLDLTEELRHRPADETLPVALRAATHQWAEQAAGRSGEMLQLMRVTQAAPVLRTRLEQAKRDHFEQLEGIVAARLQADPARDPRPRLVVALLGCVISSAIERWSEDGGEQDLVRYVDTGLDMLESGVPCVTGCAGQDEPKQEPVRHATTG